MLKQCNEDENDDNGDNKDEDYDDYNPDFIVTISLANVIYFLINIFLNIYI